MCVITLYYMQQICAHEYVQNDRYAVSVQDHSIMSIHCGYFFLTSKFLKLVHDVNAFIQ